MPGDALAMPAPVGADAVVWAEGLEVCPPLAAVPVAAVEAAVPVEAEDPAATVALPGAWTVPEGRGAAFGPTLTATSSSFVVPRRRSCRWKRRMKSPWRTVSRTKTRPASWYRLDS